ncbi:MAG: sulfatase-like hydrolase/transferase, partial [Planctomycetota bacterium]
MHSELNRREFFRAAGVAVGAAATARLASAAEPAGDRPPNFVVIFTDDQGYQDVGCFGSPDIRTPHLDKMAREGRKFTDFYVAAPVCTPSRAALLTGCYAPRVSLPGVLFPRSKNGLSDKETTIAEVLKTRGYAATCIGKWHLGFQQQFLPTRHGFDSYYGIPYSNDMSPATTPGRALRRPDDVPTPLLRDERVIEVEPDQRTLTQRYT